MKRDAIISVGKWIDSKGSVARKDLIAYLQSNGLSNPSDPSISIKQLIDKEVCYECKDGVYKPMRGKYRFKSSEPDPELYAALNEFRMPVCLCPVSQYELNGFLTLQVFSPRVIVYAPKIVHDELAHSLLGAGYQPITLRKNVSAFEGKRTIFLSGLHWRTPLDRRGKRLDIGCEQPLICGTTLEKLLIDTLAGDFEIGGAMLREFYRNALKDYAINLSTLRRYAKDRSKEEKLEEMLAKCDFKEESSD